MIIDEQPVFSKYIAVPKEMHQLSCGSFMGGVVDSILNATGFVHDSGLTFHLTAFIDLHSFQSCGPV